MADNFLSQLSGSSLSDLGEPGNQPQAVDPYALPAPMQTVDPNTAGNLAPPPAAPVAPQPAVVNALQQANPAALQAVTTGGDAPAATALAAPRKRLSLIETIGKISDALAIAGGKTPGYQGGLDAITARENAAQDHLLNNQHVQQEILSSRASQAKTDAETNAAKYSSSVKALQALGGNAADWPMVAAAHGLTPDEAQKIGALVTAHPDRLSNLAAALDKASGRQTKYSNAPITIRNDKTGQLGLLQTSDAGDVKQAELPAGWSVTEPVKTVDEGGSVGVIGARSGANIRPNIVKTLPPTVHVIDNGSSHTMLDQTGHPIATIAKGMTPAEAAKNAPGAKGDPASVLTTLDNIENGFKDLHGLNALPGEGNLLDRVSGAVGRTGVGQAVGQQFGSAAAQKRLEIAKNLSGLQQEMIKSLPASAVRTRFEQEIIKQGMPDPTKMTYGTAQTVIKQLREKYQAAVQQSSARPVLSPTPSAKVGAATVSNW